MLVVSPKTTWPTSTVRLGCALTYSASGATFERERVLVAVAAAVAVELDVGQVPAMALEELHRLERGRPVAREAEVVAVDVHRVRQFSSSTAWATDRDDLARRHAEVVDGRVEVLDVARRPAASRSRRRRD